MSLPINYTHDIANFIYKWIHTSTVEMPEAFTTFCITSVISKIFC